MGWQTSRDLLGAAFVLLALIAAGCGDDAGVADGGTPVPGTGGGIFAQGGAGGLGGGGEGSVAQGGDAGVLSPVFVSIAPNPVEDDQGGVSAGAPLEAELIVAAAGARARVISIPWNVGDSDQPGSAAELEAFAALAADLDEETNIWVELQLVDRGADRRPSSFVGVPFDDPLVRTGIENTIANLLGATEAVGGIQRLIIGRDLDVYIERNPDDAKAVAELVVAAVDAATMTAARRDNVEDLTVAVGVSHAAILRRDQLASLGGAVAFSYFPTPAPTNPYAELENDLSAAVDVAAGRPLWIVGTGQPSEGGSDVSAVKQALFFERLFDEVALRREHIELVHLSRLHDRAPSSCENESQELGEPAGTLLGDGLCSLGLVGQSGNAKPSWGVVSAALATFAAP